MLGPCLVKAGEEAGVAEPILSEIAEAGRLDLDAYLHGAMHDGTFSRLHNTLRISQADVRWLRCVRMILHHLV
jgi:hypothetical protein